VYFFWRLRKNFRDFFNRDFELPLLRNAQKRAKEIEQNNRGREKKTDGKKDAFFVMTQKEFFDCFWSCFELPVVRNAQKNATKKVHKRIKIKIKIKIK
jgi:hypothetical protein